MAFCCLQIHYILQNMADYLSESPQRGVPHFNALVGVNPYVQDREIWPKETKNTLYHMMQAYFNILNH